MISILGNPFKATKLRFSGIGERNPRAPARTFGQNREPSSEAVIKIIALLGTSYGGSTITNCLLNSARNVYGGSELRRLREMRGICAACGRACNYWTPENCSRIGSLAPHLYYPAISRLMQASAIVDGSKQMSFFERDFISRCIDGGAKFQFWNITKHPLPHMASFIANQFGEKTHGVTDYGELRRLISDYPDEVREFSYRKLKALNLFYARCLWGDTRSSMHMQPVNAIKLESIIDDPRLLFHRASIFFDIPVEEFSINYWKTEMHPVGGNRGPIYQAQAASKGDFTHSPTDRQGYYSQSTLKQDYKWTLFMPEWLVSAIAENHTYQELCNHLGYPEQAPSP